MFWNHFRDPENHVPRPLKIFAVTVLLYALLQHKRGIRKFKRSIGWTRSPSSFLDYFQTTVSFTKLNKLGISQVRGAQTVPTLSERPHLANAHGLWGASTFVKHSTNATVIRNLQIYMLFGKAHLKKEKQYLVGDAIRWLRTVCNVQRPSEAVLWQMMN